MSVLFHTLGTPSYRIFGDPGEPGAWECSCRHGGDHLHKDPITGDKGHPCKHLSRLWADARERGELDCVYFRPTAAGNEKADACRCNGEATPLLRVGAPPGAPPPGPVAGLPSRNKPCPCGWVNPALGRVDEYKRCHGNPNGPPEGAPDMPGITAAPRKTPRQAAAERGRETRREREIERRERAAIAVAVAETGDERRRAVRRLAEARRKGAGEGTIETLEERVYWARETETAAKERAKAKR